MSSQKPVSSKRATETLRERANRVATNIAVNANKREPDRFRDEDDFIEYRRELREELYESMWTHNYF